jgi:hypothetical protein
MEEAAHLPQSVGLGASPSGGEVLPLAYEEPRRLAAQELSHEKPGQTLQATALVHEAWLRLVREEDRKWQDPQHFCAALGHQEAAQVMGITRREADGLWAFGRARLFERNGKELGANHPRFSP